MRELLRSGWHLYFRSINLAWNRSSFLGQRCVAGTESHHQAFCCSTGFEELAQCNLDYVEARRFGLVAQFPADVVEDEGAAEGDGVAGEAEAAGFGAAECLAG